MVNMNDIYSCLKQSNQKKM